LRRSTRRQTVFVCDFPRARRDHRLRGLDLLVGHRAFP